MDKRQIVVAHTAQTRADKSTDADPYRPEGETYLHPPPQHFLLQEPPSASSVFFFPHPFVPVSYPITIPSANPCTNIPAPPRMRLHSARKPSDLKDKTLIFCLFMESS